MIPFEQIGPGWTLFLDRDGVINVRDFDSYILNWDSFHFTPGLLAAAAQIGKAFDRVVVVTNQQCIAKGLLTIEELDVIHNKMCNELTQAGLNIDLVLAATEFKNGQEARRKPQSKMALEAQLQLPAIDFSKSIMVGDTNTDIQFGKRLGMYTILIESKEIVKETPDFRLAKLADLSSYL
ncbi:MAG: HAD-IIIA family hydrolase [Flavobacteriales bacterium]